LEESFVLKDGQIEARLAGRYPARESGFLELLAPERRASLFQFKAADTPANAAMIKSLATFHALVNDPAEKPNETATIEAAKEFASGEDSMRVYRQLYAASRLLRKNVGFRTAYDLAEAAKSGIDAGMEVPAATVAVQADELRELRARAIASGTTPYQAEAPRSALSNIVRGRIEDLQGWVLFNEDKHSEAVDHLKRAASTIPEGTPAWRTAVWHLGAALEQTDQKEEALNNYIRSYVAGDADPVRRKLIEQLYIKIHGSLDGLDQRLAGSPTGVSVSSPAASSPTTNTGPTTTEATASGSPEPAASQPQPATSPATPVEPAPTPSAEKPVDEKPSEVPKPDEAAKQTPAKVEPSTEAAQKTNSEPTLTQDEAMAKAASRVRSIVKITGRVVDADNKGIASVVVILISPRGTVLAATTDADGNYSFNVSPSQRNYRLVPSKEGYQFDPVDRAVVAFLEDLKEIVFVGRAQ
jgi:outer membrane biosynthesis protein TonB